MKNENANSNRDQWRPDNGVPPHSIDHARMDLFNQVARQAYFLYLKEGAEHGHDVAHWLQAETALFRERDALRAEQPSLIDATQKRSGKQTPGFVL